MPPYAEATNVSEERSQSELKSMLRRAGSETIAIAEEADQVGILFRLRSISYRVQITLPDRNAAEFTRSPSGKRKRTDDQAWAAWEQETRRLWRCLVLVLKAKLTAVRDGVATVETEFLPYMVMQDGRTVAEAALPQFIAAAADGLMPKLSMLALPEASHTGGDTHGTR